MASNPTGILFVDPFRIPLDANDNYMPLCSVQFYVTGSTTPAPVFQDAAFVTAFPTTAGQYIVTAGFDGVLPVIYLDPVIQYRAILFDPTGRKLEDIDPVNVNYQLFSATVAKPVATVYTNMAVLTSDPHLEMTIPASGLMKVDLDLIFVAGAAGTTPGLQFELAISAVGGAMDPNCANTLMIMGSLNGLDCRSYGVLPQINVPITMVPLGTLPENNTMRWSGMIRGLIDPLQKATIVFRWAQANSSASSVALNAGSRMTVTLIGS